MISMLHLYIVFLKEKMDFSAWFAYALPGPSGNRQFKEPFARPKNTWAYG